MGESEGTRRDCLALNAIDPENGKMGKVQLSYERMQTVGRRGPCHVRECLFIVPMILQQPTAIFEGIRRDDDEDNHGTGWWCYCGIPECAYRADGSKRSPYPGQVYLVFVNDERVAYNWRWERADQDDPKLPENHKERFRTRKL